MLELKTADEMRTEPYRHGMDYSESCVVCGEMHRQACASIRLVSDGEALGDICPACVAAGPGGAAERAAAHAARIRAQANELDALAVAVADCRQWATEADLSAYERCAHWFFVTTEEMPR